MKEPTLYQKTKKIGVFSFYVISCLLIFILLSVSNVFGFFSFAEYKTYDARMVYTVSNRNSDDSIVVILVDQYSLDWAKENLDWGWPWPRSSYGKIVDFLSSGNVATIAFDMLFIEPSVFGQADDEAFAESCRKSGKVIQVVYQNEGKVLYPIPVISESAAVLGDITGIQDEDGVHRRARLFSEMDDKIYPSLSTACLLDRSSDFSLSKFMKQKSLLLRYKQNTTNFDKYSVYSAADILQGNEVIDASEFEDSHVFIGLYAPGLFDICTTPVSSVYPGMGIHVTALDNILSNDFIKKTPPVFDYLAAFLLSLIGTEIIILFDKCGNKRHTAVKLSLLFCGVLISYVFLVFLLFYAGWWLELVFPILCLVVSFLSAVLIAYNTEGKQRRYLKSAFRQYLSPVIIEELILHPENLKLGGERRNISIFFSDLEGFTSISEGMEPEKLTELLNEFLSAMTDIILEYGGTIDKYEGDAIIAFWNAPTDQPNHSCEALGAAVACQQKLAKMRPYLMKKYGTPLYMRIGVNTGNAIVGNMGSGNHFNYTMLGDAVNLASRLEGLNKQFGTYTMCSSFTLQEAEKLVCPLCFRELALVQVVGKSEPVRVYEPMTSEEYGKRKGSLTVFSEALSLFYKGDFEKAEKLFISITPEKLGNEKGDLVAERYAQRCQYLQIHTVNEWNGIWTAESK